MSLIPSYIIIDYVINVKYFIAINVSMNSHYYNKYTRHNTMFLILLIDSKFEKDVTSNNN